MQYDNDSEQKVSESAQEPGKRSPFGEIHWLGIALVSLGIGFLIFLMWLAYLYSMWEQGCQRPGSCF